LPLPRAWRELRAARFPDIPEDCGNRAAPGVFLDHESRDWTRRGTTRDQFRMERYIDRFDLAAKRILHIGVGNSGLAQRLKGRAGEIVGTTIDQPEVDWAQRIGLPRYTVLLHNKYGDDPALVPGQFDFIVDNNPTSFCCCMAHLAELFDFYTGKLAPGAQVITDQLGLGWLADDGVPRFQFDFDDLAAVARLAGLSAYRINRDVYVLSRTTPPPPGALPLLRHYLRHYGSFPRRAIGRVRRELDGVRARKRG
jgi:hypothetical protein